MAFSAWFPALLRGPSPRRTPRLAVRGQTWLSSVRSKMPCRSVCLEQPAATAWSSQVCSEAASGSLVTVCSVQARGDHRAGLSALPVSCLSWSLTSCLGLGGVGGDPVVGGDLPVDQGLDGVRVRLQEGRGHHQVGGGELAVRPQRCARRRAPSPPPSSTRREAQGSGTQAPSILPASNRSSVVALSCGCTSTSPAPCSVGRRPLLEPVAQRDVLGVAELRGGDGLALEVGDGGDPGLHHELGAAVVGAGDDAQRLAVRLRRRR